METEKMEKCRSGGTKFKQNKRKREESGEDQEKTFAKCLSGVERVSLSSICGLEGSEYVSKR